jgi:hypothetical protein
MWENGREVKGMVKESSTGQMDPYMKGNGETINEKEMEE